MAWSKWIDLAMPKPEPAMATSMPYDLSPPSGPQYPYGMRISLDGHCLDEANLDIGDVDEDTEIDIRAFGKVISFYNDEGRRSVTIQLTRIKVENEDTEDEKD